MADRAPALPAEPGAVRTVPVRYSLLIGTAVTTIVWMVIIIATHPDRDVDRAYYPGIVTLGITAVGSAYVWPAGLVRARNIPLGLVGAVVWFAVIFLSVLSFGALPLMTTILLSVLPRIRQPLASSVRLFGGWRGMLGGLMLFATLCSTGLVFTVAWTYYYDWAAAACAVLYVSLFLAGSAGWPAQKRRP